ncbi:Hypothetical protein ZAZAV_493 [Cedratvirus Zaza IHUMI]|uniref:Uncharacterized protein n=1 Tax=Cedratvirus Zaza IHUMI TaxID=2126979 RepID=A0A2R8FFN9_9VIRU|nr:Hypothetical protein ZAZAV_493 [Cedratvirus Zaza IHUMI]
MDKTKDPRYDAIYQQKLAHHLAKGRRKQEAMILAKVDACYILDLEEIFWKECAYCDKKVPTMQGWGHVYNGEKVCYSCYRKRGGL